VKIGANGNIDTSTATPPVQAFVLTNAGLMAGVSLEGTRSRGRISDRHTVCCPTITIAYGHKRRPHAMTPWQERIGRTYGQ
jgi:lipid-binding SYLF domain-containing protein